MGIAITIFGLLIAAMSLLVLITPATPIRIIEAWRGSGLTPLRIFASVIRIALGILLILGAASTRYPITVEVIGWLVLAVGIAFLLISSTLFDRLLSWVIGWLSPARVRIGGLLGAVFGGFLAFAAA